MDKDDNLKKIMEEEDYIRCPKCNNSLAKFLERNPDGVKDNMIAKLLMLSEEQVEELYEQAIKKLRKGMAEHSED